MIGNMLETGSGYFGMLVLDHVGVGWGMLLVMRSPLHGMINFPELYLW
jgi:hypothetical protein